MVKLVADVTHVKAELGPKSAALRGNLGADTYFLEKAHHIEYSVPYLTCEHTGSILTTTFRWLS